MRLIDLPAYKFVTPWAADAASGQVTSPIPATAVGGAASQQQGFPLETATNEAAGGIPPNFADFNGFGNYCTSWERWFQLGGPIQYDGAFSAAISPAGYPKGALLSSTTVGSFWVSTADNNTTDPDGMSPANWQNLFAPVQAIIAKMFKTITQYAPPDRELNTVYDNMTGYPMKVSATGLNTGTFINFNIFVNGLSIPTLRNGLAVNGEVCLSEIVPAGGNYQLTYDTTGTGVVTLQSVTEFTQAP